MTRKARILLISLLAVAGISLSGCSGNDFNAWLDACAREDGHAALTQQGFWSNRYECFKNDEVIVVPGYEGQ